VTCRKMSSILPFLSRWEGRGPVEARFLARGFGVSELYQRRIAEYCGEDAGVKTYWDEVSKERAQSFGVIDSDRRIFSNFVGYRSEYLDGLEGEFLPDACGVLNPCLRLLHGHHGEAREIYLRIREEINSEKLLEAAAFGFSDVPWGGTKVEVAEIVKDAAFLHGFDMCQRNFRLPTGVRGLYNKVVGSEYEFVIALDMGGRNLLSGKLNIMFFVCDFAGGRQAFWGDLGKIIPGSQYYSLIGTKENIFGSTSMVRLGVKALVALFDELSAGFS
jgi:hypothetical protein